MENDNSSSSESSSSYEDEIEQLMDDENGDIKKDTESKRNKSKNKKKQKQLNIKPEFLEYFEAFKTRNEFIVSENPQIKGLDFTMAFGGCKKFKLSFSREIGCGLRG